MPKATVRSKNKEIAALTEQLKQYKEKVRAFVLSLYSVSNRRPLMTVGPSNADGLINGLTVPELIMLVNLNEGTGEVTLLETSHDKKTLLVVAKKRINMPVELL